MIYNILIQYIIYIVLIFNRGFYGYQIKEIPTEIGNFENLEELYVNNKIKTKINFNLYIELKEIKLLIINIYLF